MTQLESTIEATSIVDLLEETTFIVDMLEESTYTIDLLGEVTFSTIGILSTNKNLNLKFLGC